MFVLGVFGRISLRLLKLFLFLRRAFIPASAATKTDGGGCAARIACDCLDARELELRQEDVVSFSSSVTRALVTERLNWVRRWQLTSALIHVVSFCKWMRSSGIGWTHKTSPSNFECHSMGLTRKSLIFFTNVSETNWKHVNNYY